MKRAVIMLFIIITMSINADTLLYILSGQSNMNKVDTNAFRKVVSASFPDDEVLVVKLSKSGRPIRDWDESWTASDGTIGKRQGKLYKMLMNQVEPLITDKTIDVATFVWMQGEADARQGHGDVYENSLRKLIAEIKKDSKSKNFNFVIGRLSDYGDNKPEERPDWLKIKEIQMRVADEVPNGKWVDTDDLNGSHNGLHYNSEGYRILTQRFAEASVELTKNSLRQVKNTQ